jgi:hypothetical protein
MCLSRFVSVMIPMRRQPSTTGSAPTLFLTMRRAATSIGSSGATEITWFDMMSLIETDRSRIRSLDAVLESAHRKEMVPQVAIGDDADHLAVAPGDRKVTYLMVEHSLNRLVARGRGIDGDDSLAHELSNAHASSSFLTSDVNPGGGSPR